MHIRPKFKNGNTDPGLILFLCCRCLDILELSEHEDLRKFHYHTLMLYCALCALGNTRVAHALCSHLDQSQLLYTIDNQYLSGMLREGFYSVLIRLKLFIKKFYNVAFLHGIVKRIPFNSSLHQH